MTALDVTCPWCNAQPSTDAHAVLEALPKGSVVLDRHGQAWQFAGIHWYRAFDSEQSTSAHSLSHKHPFTIIHKGQTT